VSALLYAFGVGLAFAVGVSVGAYLCALAVRRGNKVVSDVVNTHNARVEDRLAKYVEHTERIALALEKAVQK
jgi:hypothetical protein